VALSSTLHHHIQSKGSRKKTLSLLKSSKIQAQLKESVLGITELLRPDEYTDTQVVFQQLLPNLSRFLVLLLTPAKEGKTVLGDVGGEGSELFQVIRLVVASPPPMLSMFIGDGVSGVTIDWAQAWEVRELTTEGGSQ
jgi:hypothetical protein